MKHYIIVKFTEGTDVKALVEPVRAIFEETLAIPGIHSLDIRVSNSDIANRYDMMIKIKMRKGALPSFEERAINKIWEENYKDKIKIVTVFDR